MELYKQYIKSGEILMAPSSDFKELYLLKCNVCEEYLSRFETFLSHHLTHYNSEEFEEPQSPSGALYELYSDMDENDMQASDSAHELVCDEEKDSFKIVHNTTIKPLSKDDVIEKLSDNEGLMQRSQEEKHTTKLQEHLNEEKIGSGDLYLTDDDSNDDMSNPVEEPKTSRFVSDFMKSHESVLKLIELYRKKPMLWNTNISTHLKSRNERIKYLEEISTELKNSVGSKVSYKQLHTIIIYLRRYYRKILLKNGEAEEQEQRDHRRAPWFCQHLYFLKPFLEKNPLAVLDNYADELKPQQIVQILQIYQRCPFLWNSSLIENHCYNKRSEGIDQMKSLIQLEMALDVSKTTLQKYVNCINRNFSREKRRYMGVIISEEGQSEYFEHMMFLYDHIGPFQCEECRRVFKSLLQMKVHTFEHDGRIPLRCSECQKGFKTVEAYVIHVRRHMKDFNKRCSECGKGFLKECELKNHLQVHAAVRPYNCEVCGTFFHQPQELKIHIMRHDKIFTFFCPKCSKGFYNKSDVEVHVKKHSVERDFVCQTCKKAFKTKKHMVQHELTHEKGRNHICVICDKAFKNKLNLTQHSKVHLRNGRQ